jgi:hypothetical protein
MTQPTPDETYLLRKLQARDDRWLGVKWSLIHRLNHDLGPAVVTSALRMATENGEIRVPAPWLIAACHGHNDEQVAG